jgi:hypothetical protein
LFATASNAQSLYPPCSAALLANETNFIAQERYTDTIGVALQIGPDVNLGLTCGGVAIPDTEGYSIIGFNDWGAGLYWADPDISFTSDTTIHQYTIRRVCDDGSGKPGVVIKDGYFNAIPQPDPVTGQMMDYLVFDGRIHAQVAKAENLDKLVVFRDPDQQIVARAAKSGTRWVVVNPRALSSELIGFVLTHRVNKNAHCWGNGAGDSGSGLGSWAKIGIAVAVSATVSAIVTSAIFCACKLLKKPAERRIIRTGEMDELV